MKGFNRFKKEIVWSILTVTFLCACKVHKMPNLKHELLNQAQIMANWQRDAEDELGMPPAGKSWDEYFWLIPREYEPKENEFNLRINNVFGGPFLIVRYAMQEEDVKEECYVNITPGQPVALPVTSRGIEVETQVWNKGDLKAENIFVITADSTIAEYKEPDLEKLGWRVSGGNKFNFKIPANNTGKPRLWCVRLYYSDRAGYDAYTLYINDFFGVDYLKNTRWTLGPLYFLQVTDSLNPADLYAPALQPYIDLLPESDKWLPDPEGGYKF